MTKRERAFATALLKIAVELPKQEESPYSKSKFIQAQEIALKAIYANLGDGINEMCLDFIKKTQTER